ncbi:MAG TPA: polysaccharide pyruvyl transferase family protein [Thermoanaerobaculia bacterium]|nr:polysaccharide pyruvyl transferase family protein [Thermoanaerobaculia bacterium]
MSTREWQIALVGTFDVENYGDLLFPLIAEAELAERLGRVKLHCFSYAAKTAAEWPFPVTSITELPRLAAGLDGLLVGGGFLVRFDKQVAAGYGPPTPAIHHPTGFWLSPALIALQHGIPLLWNAPGVSYSDLPAWGDPLMELTFSQSSYIAVRDEPSRLALTRFVDPDRIAVVPDTVFGIGRRLQEPPSLEFSRLRQACGLTGPYIILQGVRGLDSCCRFLKRHADRLRGFRFLALPIGPVNGDDTAFLDADLPGLVRLPSWPQRLVLAELIRQAAAVIGPSFHLAITALTAGVPIFSPADLTVGKFPGLQDFAGIYPLPTEHDPDPSGFLSRLGRAAVSPQVGAAVDRLAEHWDRVAAVLQGGVTGTPVEVGRFWQSLPGVLEETAVRRDAAVAALEARSQTTATLAAEREENTQRIAELLKLLALARQEIATRDRRIGELLASTSWKVTAPFRFAGRRLGR